MARARGSYIDSELKYLRWLPFIFVLSSSSLSTHHASPSLSLYPSLFLSFAAFPPRAYISLISFFFVTFIYSALMNGTGDKSDTYFDFARHCPPSINQTLDGLSGLFLGPLSFSPPHANFHSLSAYEPRRAFERLSRQDFDVASSFSLCLRKSGRNFVPEKHRLPLKVTRRPAETQKSR